MHLAALACKSNLQEYAGYITEFLYNITNLSYVNYLLKTLFWGVIEVVRASWSKLTSNFDCLVSYKVYTAQWSLANVCFQCFLQYYF